MKKTASLVALAALVAGPALAGGPVVVAPEPVVVAPVAPVVANGDWAGFYAGVQLGYADVDGGDFGDGNGVIGGVHAGYRWDLGKTVLGVEADYDASNVEHDDSGAELDSVARLKAMVGYDAGRTLVYGTLGAAYADASVGGDSYSDTGYFGGVGVDYALTESWTLGGELLLHRFDNFDDTGIDYDATTIRAKVSYRF